MMWKLRGTKDVVPHKWLWLALSWGVNGLTFTLYAPISEYKFSRTDLHTFGHSWDSKSYYSFKIFPQFWLAKSTRIIHHNWLLMTKFGRILCLTRKWRKKCSPLQVKALLPRRPVDEVEWFWLWKKKKMADTSLISRVRTTAGTRWNNGYKHSKNSKKITRRGIFNICGAGQT